MSRFTAPLPSVQIFLSFALITFLGVAPGAEAEVISCDGEVRDILVYARGQSEGNVVVSVKLDGGGVRAWTICNINEDKIQGGVAVSKNGKPLLAAQDSYSSTCKTLLNSIHIGKATNRKVRFAFLDSTFPTCESVPSWGGVVGGDSDDPGGRLGAWDGLFYIQVLGLEAASH